MVNVREVETCVANCCQVMTWTCLFEFFRFYFDSKKSLKSPKLCQNVKRKSQDACFKKTFKKVKLMTLTFWGFQIKSSHELTFPKKMTFGTSLGKPCDTPCQNIYA
jgi:hypothetical protein